MKDPWGTIRAVSLTVILGGLLVIGGGRAEPAAASVSGCFMCVSSCPADVQQYCDDMGCVGSGICYERHHTSECGPNFTISCDLI